MRLLAILLDLVVLASATVLAVVFREEKIPLVFPTATSYHISDLDFSMVILILMSGGMLAHDVHLLARKKPATTGPSFHGAEVPENDRSASLVRVLVRAVQWVLPAFALIALAACGIAIWQTLEASIFSPGLLTWVIMLMVSVFVKIASLVGELYLKLFGARRCGT